MMLLGGSNRIGQDTSEKEGEINEWPNKLKKVSKVSRRVPTAISLFFVNDVYGIKRKKRNTRQTQTKKQLE